MEPLKKLLQTKFFYEFNQRKNEVNNLQNLILDFIPKSLHTKIQVKNYTKDILIIEADNGAVAHTLKMYESTLLNKVNQTQILDHHIKKIKVKVSVFNPLKQKKAKKIPSSVNKKLKIIAKDMSDSPLKDIMKDLFKTKS